MRQSDPSSSPLETLRRAGKTFAWAGAFLRKEQLELAGRLYAFCRTLDDLADESHGRDADRELEQTYRAIAAGSPSCELAHTFLTLEAEAGLEREAALDLISTLRSDLQSVRIQTRTELIQYCEGAAGTVGRLMLPILGVVDSRARTCAIHLGVAMQMTNIARDVYEDASMGRRYLPLEWFPTGEAPSAENIVTGARPTRRRVQQATARLLSLADEYYRSAERGFHFIPRKPRFAILVAARAYERIGVKVLEIAGRDRWGQRAFVSIPEKALITVISLVELITSPSLWARRKEQPVQEPNQANHEGFSSP